MSGEQFAAAHSGAMAGWGWKAGNRGLLLRLTPAELGHNDQTTVCCICKHTAPAQSLYMCSQGWCRAADNQTGCLGLQAVADDSQAVNTIKNLLRSGEMHLQPEKVAAKRRCPRSLVNQQSNICLSGSGFVLYLYSLADFMLGVS